MICLLTERRLTPDSYPQFRAAWEPERLPDVLVRAYHLRDVTDPDHVISFGIFDATPEDFARLFEDPELREQQAARIAAMAEFIASIGVDGVFEVVDEVTGPPG
jgi:hypothetical protein